MLRAAKKPLRAWCEANSVEIRKNAVDEMDDIEVRGQILRIPDKSELDLAKPLAL